MTEPTLIPESNVSEHHPFKRVMWLDVLRVLAILCVITGHMGPPVGCYPVIHWVLGTFGLPVYFFFFASALFLKDDTKLLLKRALLIYVSYVVWAVICYYLYPEIKDAVAVVSGEKAVPHPSAPLWQCVEPGWTVRAGGHLWFLRALAVLTVLSPMFVKWRARYVTCLLFLLFCFNLFLETAPADLTGWQENLPFLLQKGAGLESSILFLAGVVIRRMGGISFLTRLSGLPILLLIMLVVLPMVGFFLHYPLLSTYSVSVPFKVAALLSFGLLLHRISVALSARSFYNRCMKFVGLLAPGVFFVYAAHFIHPIVTAWGETFKGIWPLPLYRMLMTCLPAIVFILCYLAYLPLNRIPYISRVLCFASARKRGAKP